MKITVSPIIGVKVRGEHGKKKNGFALNLDGRLYDNLFFPTEAEAIDFARRNEAAPFVKLVGNYSRWKDGDPSITCNSAGNLLPKEKTMQTFEEFKQKPLRMSQKLQDKFQRELEKKSDMILIDPPKCDAYMRPCKAAATKLVKDGDGTLIFCDDCFQRLKKDLPLLVRASETTHV
jgi:hypothetical protein